MDSTIIAALSSTKNHEHQTDVSAIEDEVIFLYSQGISTRGIQKTIQEMYGIDVDDSRVSKITDKILPLIKEW